jgi:hypothetical protein
MEDDDGFVFTRAPKRKTQPTTSQAQIPPPAKLPAKPFVMDFTADVLSPRKWDGLIIDSCSS